LKLFVFKNKFFGKNIFASTTIYFSAMAKQIKKTDLPQKVCVTCGRPFLWRKKWEKVWDEVKYCSERCRKGKAGNDKK